MTANKVLFVEGRDDKWLFTSWLTELLGTHESSVRGIEIDTAEMIESPPGQRLGNREKAEALCATIALEPTADKFVALVDREFREFRWEPTLDDNLRGHRVDGRLVWTRGHSIENYYFDFLTLREPMKSFCRSDRFPVALAMFEEVFHSALGVACAVSLAGRDVGYISALAGSINWRLLDVGAGVVALDTSVWAPILQDRLGLPTGVAASLASRYGHWLMKVRAADPEVTRWMCHGHVGLAMLWATYARCVYDTTGQDEAETNRVLAAEHIRFSHCADAWVRREAELHESPRIVLELLGVLPHAERSVLRASGV